MKSITKDFEALHGIPLILGAIYDSHIPIITPFHDLVAYYLQKGYYLCIIQGIVDANSNFGTTILDGLDEFIVGPYFRIRNWEQDSERCIFTLQIHC